MKLNLGCGKRPLEGFDGVDKKEGEGVKYVHDLIKPLPFKDNEVDGIYASHIIEHFWWDKVFDVVKDWYRVLKPGAQIDIWTVDFDILVYHFMNHEDKDFMQTMKGLNWRLYSTNRYDGDAHHCIFNYRLLGSMLMNAGFKQIERINSTEYPFKPMHDGINLGVRAVK